MSDETIFAVYWFYKVTPEYRRLDARDRVHLCDDFAKAVEAHVGGLTLRGAYSLVGLRHDADFLLWLHGPSLNAAQDMAVAVRKTGLGAYLETPFTYTGMVSPSRYAPEHGPAFMKGEPPRGYLSVYPFTKTHAWYHLPFERRRALMAEHGALGQAHSALVEGRVATTEATGYAKGAVATAVVKPATQPRGSVLANTVHSFGLGDQEFVVAFESDDPAALERMVEDLRAAEVRLYTACDTPIFLCRRKSLRAVLDDLA
jgi:hydrogen peroxide-dependent heme synthase